MITAIEPKVVEAGRYSIAETIIYKGVDTLFIGVI